MKTWRKTHVCTYTGHTNVREVAYGLKGTRLLAYGLKVTLKSGLWPCSYKDVGLRLYGFRECREDMGL